MQFENLQYMNYADTDNPMCIFGLVDGEATHIPIGNNDIYDEVMRQVEAGTLTIQDAE